MVYVCVDSQDA